MLLPIQDIQLQIPIYNVPIEKPFSDYINFFFESQKKEYILHILLVILGIF